MNSQAQTADDTAVGVDPRRWWALAILVMAQFVTILDTAIVTVALPSIQHALGFSESNLQWVVTAYTIFFGGMLLLGGRLADLQGRRLMFMGGLVLFTAASAFNGAAWNDTALIVGRAVQGLGAALLVPAALSLLVTTFPEGRERTLALGVWSAATAAGGSFGLLLGGVLTQAVSWRWIFFVNIPIGAIVLALSPRFLREGRTELPERRFDLAGAATITTSLMMLVYATTRAAQKGWGATETIALLTGSAVLLAAFLAIESRTRAPLLPLRMFRRRTLAGSNLSGVFAGVALGGFFIGTLYMQLVLGYSPIRTGLSFLSLSLSVVAAAGIAQSLVNRIGIRPIVSAGFIVSAAAIAWLAQIPVHGHYWANIFGPFVILGVGLALVYVGQQVGAQAGLPPEEAGIASGLITTSQQVGGALAVALASTIYTTAAAHYASHHGVNALAGPALTHGFQIVFYVFAAAAALAAVLAALLLQSRSPQSTVAPALEPALEAGA
jgi:EmrB/QacA subfamily drug resistance transporter